MQAISHTTVHTVGSSTAERIHGPALPVPAVTVCPFVRCSVQCAGHQSPGGVRGRGHPVQKHAAQAQPCLLSSRLLSLGLLSPCAPRGVAVCNVLDIKAAEECVVVGTLYKSMQLKPSILDEYSTEVSHPRIAASVWSTLSLLIHSSCCVDFLLC